MKTDRDLASFVSRLESLGLLKCIGRPTSVIHEITEIAAGGPALLFERPVSAAGSIGGIPVLVWFPAGAGARVVASSRRLRARPVHQNN